MKNGDNYMLGDLLSTFIYRYRGQYKVSHETIKGQSRTPGAKKRQQENISFYISIGSVIKFLVSCVRALL